RFTFSLCNKRWASAQVKLVFRMQLNKSQGRGKVIVHWYKRKCRVCEGSTFEEPNFSDDNVKKMLDKLMEKIRFKFYNERHSQTRNYFYFERDMNGPHEEKHCEACIKGICRHGWR
ncbi:RTP3 protein, partial [Amia calva]|nr:RTP3 protein [Amia calva]